jgi:hypothetical protein
MKHARNIFCACAFLIGILAAAHGCGGCVSPQGSAGWITLEGTP